MYTYVRYKRETVGGKYRNGFGIRNKLNVKGKILLTILYCIFSCMNLHSGKSRDILVKDRRIMWVLV